MVAHYNAQKQIDGIICDLCNTINKDKFRYYSAKYDLVVVDNVLQTTGVVDVDRRCLDLDICDVCMKKMMQKVKKNISERSIEENNKSHIRQTRKDK